MVAANVCRGNFMVLPEESASCRDLALMVFYSRDGITRAVAPLEMSSACGGGYWRRMTSCRARMRRRRWARRCVMSASPAKANSASYRAGLILRYIGGACFVSRGDKAEKRLPLRNEGSGISGE